MACFLELLRVKDPRHHVDILPSVATYTVRKVLLFVNGSRPPAAKVGVRHLHHLLFVVLRGDGLVDAACASCSVVGSSFK